MAPSVVQHYLAPQYIVSQLLVAMNLILSLAAGVNICVSVLGVPAATFKEGLMLSPNVACNQAGYAGERDHLSLVANEPCALRHAMQPCG